MIREKERKRKKEKRKEKVKDRSKRVTAVKGKIDNPWRRKRRIKINGRSGWPSVKIKPAQLFPPLLVVDPS